MDTGEVVNLTAMSGTDTANTPSAKLLAIAADHKRLNACENVLIEILQAFLDCAPPLLSRYPLLPFPFLTLG